MKPTIQLSASKLFRGLSCVVLALVLANVSGQVSVYLWSHQAPWLETVAWAFNISTEYNVPTFYSAAALLLCALLLTIIAVVERQSRARFANHWNVLGFLFLYLAADEGLRLHERTIDPIRALLREQGIQAHGMMRTTWVLVAIPLVIIVGLAFLRFFLHLPARVRTFFFVSASLFLAGAIVMEVIGGYYASIHGVKIVGGHYENLSGSQDFIYVALTTLEETLEMLAIVIFNYTLISYLGTRVPEVAIRFADVESGAQGALGQQDLMPSPELAGTDLQLVPVTSD